jgi:hypothetical protein
MYAAVLVSSLGLQMKSFSLVDVPQVSLIIVLCHTVVTALL